MGLVVFNLVLFSIRLVVFWNILVKISIKQIFFQNLVENRGSQIMRILMNKELKEVVMQKEEYYGEQIGWFLVRGFGILKENMRIFSIQRKGYQVIFSSKQQNI